MEVNHKKMEKLVRKSYVTKRPIFVAGTTGIGKSYTIKKVAEDIAKEEKRTLVEWNRISDKEKQELEHSVEKRKEAFLFVDLRISQLDPSDLRGLPKLNGKDFVEWKPTLLFRLLSLDSIKGILFFDEMNLAPPSVQASAYQIILDKCIGEIAINPDICILGAGNRLEDKANVFEMSAPLKNRFTHCTLSVPTTPEWIDWALNNEIDDRIVSYLQFKPSYLMADLNKLKQYKSSAFASPRAWAFCSDLIVGEKDLDDLEMYTSSCVGDGIATEFTAFLKLRTKIDLNSIFDNPEQAKGLELDMKWSLISLISERYRENSKVLNKALGVCPNLEPEFSASLLRMLKRQNESDFNKNVVKCKNFKMISEKYGKYIRKRVE